MRIYACLIGKWTDITDTGEIDKRDPVIFIKEELGNSSKGQSFDYDYLNVTYNGNDYRIHTSMIQIVT